MQNTAVAAQTNDLATLEPSEAVIRAAMMLPERNLDEFKERLKLAICSDHEIARRTVYCKPVGKRDGLMTFELGPGIRATEIAMQHYHSLWVRSATVDEVPASYANGRTKPGSVTTYSICFDLRTLNMTSAEDTSPVYSENTKETARDRSFSLSRRDAIMQQVRPQLDAIEDDIHAAIIMGFGKSDDEETCKREAWAWIVGEYEKYGVSKELLHIVSDTGKTPKAGIVKLIGVLNYLETSGKPASDVFGTGSSKPRVTMPKPRAAQNNGANSPATRTRKGRQDEAKAKADPQQGDKAAAPEAPPTAATSKSAKSAQAPSQKQPEITDQWVSEMMQIGKADEPALVSEINDAFGLELASLAEIPENARQSVRKFLEDRP